MPDGMTREEHIEWCKTRALKYCDAVDHVQAFSSMVSDLGKHPDTRKHPAIQLGMAMLMGGRLSSQSAMRTFIEGFN